MRANSWLYQFYSLHSKMHYGLAYEAHTTRLPTYYPTAAPTVMSHAYHHHAAAAAVASAGGAEAATVPLHSVPYHIHSAITPLNGTPGHRHPHHPHHPQAVLQYSPQAGSLPYPSIVAAVNATTQSITDIESIKQQSVTCPKRTLSPQMAQQTEQQEECESPEPPQKRQNLGHHNLPPPPSSTYHHPRASTFSYPTSVFGAGGFTATSMTTVTEFGSVMPSYYGGPQVLTSVPYHAQIGHHFRNQSKLSLLDESDNSDLEQSLTPTNTEEMSNIITFSSPAYLKYPTSMMSYQYHDLIPDRDLDKVRSPESIISTTSDYGSMTSQSPPSAFEKPNKKESLTFLSNNITDNNSVSNNIVGTNASNSSSNCQQICQTFKNNWSASPIYTDLSTSRPSHIVHHQIEKDLEPLDHRFTFPNVIWGYNADNPSMSQISIGLEPNPLHLQQQYFNELRNNRVNSEEDQVNNSDAAALLVSAPQREPISATGLQPQAVTNADIPSQSSSPASTATASPVELSSSSCGVGRAAGYVGISSSIAKGERTARATAQDSA